MPSSYAAAAASSSRRPVPTTTAAPTTRIPAPRPAPAPSPPIPSPVSDSDPSSYSSSGDETDLSACDPATKSILSTYLSVAGDGADLSKVGIFLNSAARRRSPPCLICLDPIRPSDPVWSCSALRYSTSPAFSHGRTSHQPPRLPPPGAAPSATSPTPNPRPPPPTTASAPRR
jgi:NF-X1-type zinc finger protein NFXL1